MGQINWNLKEFGHIYRESTKTDLDALQNLEEGQIGYAEDTKKWYKYDGSSWTELSSGGVQNETDPVWNAEKGQYAKLTDLTGKQDDLEMDVILNSGRPETDKLEVVSAHILTSDDLSGGRHIPTLNKDLVDKEYSDDKFVVVNRSSTTKELHSDHYITNTKKDGTRKNPHRLNDVIDVEFDKAWNEPTRKLLHEFLKEIPETVYNDATGVAGVLNGDIKTFTIPMITNHLANNGDIIELTFPNTTIPVAELDILIGQTYDMGDLWENSAFDGATLTTKVVGNDLIITWDKSAKPSIDFTSGNVKKVVKLDTNEIQHRHIKDLHNSFTTDTVEGALDELVARIDGVNSVNTTQDTNINQNTSKTQANETLINQLQTAVHNLQNATPAPVQRIDYGTGQTLASQTDALNSVSNPQDGDKLELIEHKADGSTLLHSFERINGKWVGQSGQQVNLQGVARSVDLENLFASKTYTVASVDNSSYATVNDLPTADNSNENVVVKINDLNKWFMNIGIDFNGSKLYRWVPVADGNDTLSAGQTFTRPNILHEFMTPDLWKQLDFEFLDGATQTIQKVWQGVPNLDIAHNLQIRSDKVVVKGNSETLELNDAKIHELNNLGSTYASKNDLNTGLSGKQDSLSIDQLGVLSGDKFDSSLYMTSSDVHRDFWVYTKTESDNRYVSKYTIDWTNQPALLSALQGAKDPTDPNVQTISGEFNSLDFRPLTTSDLPTFIKWTGHTQTFTAGTATRFANADKTLQKDFVAVNGNWYVLGDYGGKTYLDDMKYPVTVQPVTTVDYQTRTDNNLRTTSKTIVGAINELLGDVNNIQVPHDEDLGQFNLFADLPTPSLSNFGDFAEVTNDSGQTDPNDPLTAYDRNGHYIVVHSNGGHYSWLKVSDKPSAGGSTSHNQNDYPITFINNVATMPNLNTTYKDTFELFINDTPQTAEGPHYYKFKASTGVTSNYSAQSSQYIFEISRTSGGSRDKVEIQYNVTGSNPYITTTMKSIYNNVDGYGSWILRKVS